MMGGRETARRHGPEYMRELAKKAAEARWAGHVRKPVPEGRGRNPWKRKSTAWAAPVEGEVGKIAGQ